jgi:hypothetical protein
MLKKIAYTLLILSLLVPVNISPATAESSIAEEGRISVDGATTTWNKNLYSPDSGCLKFLVTYTNNSQDSRLYFEALVLDKFGTQISSGVNTYYNLSIGATQQRELQICGHQVNNPPFVMRVSNYFSDARKQTYSEAPFQLLSRTTTTEPTPMVTVPKLKKITITCIKGKTIKKVSGTNPKCPKGFKQK